MCAFVHSFFLMSRIAHFYAGYRRFLGRLLGTSGQDDRIRTLLDDNNLRTYGEFGTMRIVLTNDDGIEAPGLLAARRALEKVGDVITVAPDQNRSGGRWASPAGSLPR